MFDYGETVQHVYSQLGTYTVTLTVTDNDGLTSTVSKQIVVVLQGESNPDSVDNALEQIVSKYPYPSRLDHTNSHKTGCHYSGSQYFSTTDPAVRQEIVDDVIKLVALYFQIS